MWFKRPWRLPAQAGISPAWQPEPPEDGSLLRSAIWILESGYCDSSLLAAAPADTLLGAASGNEAMWARCALRPFELLRFRTALERRNRGVAAAHRLSHIVEIA